MLIDGRYYNNKLAPQTKLKTGFYCRSMCFHNVALLFIYCSKNSLPTAVLHILHSTETGTNNVTGHKNACYLSVLVMATASYSRTSDVSNHIPQ